MKLIVAADKNWGIGCKNELLVRIPDDMKRFREFTTGNVVIMGRKTLESFPNAKPLKNRINIVITRNENYKAEGAVIVHSIDEAVEEAKKYADKDIYVIGGGSIYRDMLEYCDTAYVTYLDYAYEADTFIPKIGEMPDEWYLSEESEENTYFDLEYYYRTYKRK